LCRKITFWQRKTSVSSLQLIEFRLHLLTLTGISQRHLKCSKHAVATVTLIVATLINKNNSNYISCSNWLPINLKNIFLFIYRYCHITNNTPLPLVKNESRRTVIRFPHDHRAKNELNYTDDRWRCLRDRWLVHDSVNTAKLNWYKYCLFLIVENFLKIYGHTCQWIYYSISSWKSGHEPWTWKLTLNSSSVTYALFSVFTEQEKLCLFATKLTSDVARKRHGAISPQTVVLPQTISFEKNSDFICDYCTPVCHNLSQLWVQTKKNFCSLHLQHCFIPPFS